MSVYLIDNGQDYSSHSQYLVVVPEEIDSDFELFMRLEPNGMFMEAKMPSALLLLEGQWIPATGSDCHPFYAHSICEDYLWPQISGKVQRWLIHGWNKEPSHFTWHVELKAKYGNWLNPERWEPPC